MSASDAKRGLTARVVEVFITSKLSILLLVASFAAGAVALALTPREEEPQIVVPFADVFVPAPGLSAEEVERTIATPVEQRLSEIDGVENVYAMARPELALVTVRFHVGQDRERSLVKLYNKLVSTQDQLPPTARGWLVKPVEVDDVPIVTLALVARDDRIDLAGLRRIGDELTDKLQQVADTGRCSVIGGVGRKVRVELDPAKLAAYGLDALSVTQAIRAADGRLASGSLQTTGRALEVESGPALACVEDVRSVVVSAIRSRLVYLGDVAAVEDCFEEPASYTRTGFGPAAAQVDGEGLPRGERPSVTVTIAKRKGTNAVRVAENVLERVDALEGTVIPENVSVLVTRNYGETANEKVNELVSHLLVAIATIVFVLAVALGPKEAVVVALAVPMTLAVTLTADLIAGYTVNRVTLFALILALGLLVDDPIVDVENIFRHLRLGREKPLDATLTAVEEVRPPTILATFTVIVSFLPMFFITGMSGPYMAPMAFNVPVAMLVSLLVAFTVTPWASYYLLRSTPAGEEREHEDGALVRAYRRLLLPLVASRKKALGFLLGVGLAVIGSSLLAVFRLVPLKMLPFDNKNELQVVIDMPAGTPLERTDAVAREVGDFLRTVPEVTDYETYVGLASPLDFNGLVRHSYLRAGAHQGDVRVSLVPKAKRVQKSHEIALRIRPGLDAIAMRTGANLKLVEVPPGPPVLATLVAEVRAPLGASWAEQVAIAKDVRARFAKTAGVVDVDDFADAERPKLVLRLDRAKAALHGVAPAAFAETLRIAVGGVPAAVIHDDRDRRAIPVEVRVPRQLRSSVEDLLALRVRSAGGESVPLSEIATAVEAPAESTIFHKDLRRTVFVVAEMAGRPPVEAVLDIARDLEARPLPDGYDVELAGEGEWKITLLIFRDLGVAFGAALVLIYVLLVAQTGSLTVPLVIMVAIPLTMIGIMPGFYLLNAGFTTPIGSYENLIFFTATGMVGMIALAGIVVRNSIILIDFIEHHRRAGSGIHDAIAIACGVRLRPILLTASAAMLGSVVITLDPIFSGLAWSFIFGIFASTAFTLLVVPVIYNLSATRSSRGNSARPVVRP
jgi:multidrug efflux pump subunit AcrB